MMIDLHKSKTARRRLKIFWVFWGLKLPAAGGKKLGSFGGLLRKIPLYKKPPLPIRNQNLLGGFS